MNTLARSLIALVTTLSLSFAFGADEKAAVADGIKNVPLDLHTIESLAVQEGGRKKPLQTVAIESVESIVGRPLMGNTFYKDKSGLKFGAMDLYLSLWFQPDYWKTKPIILASNAKFRKAIGVENAEDEKWLSPQALATSKELEKLFSEMRNVKAADYSDVQREASLIFKRLEVLQQVMGSEDALGLTPNPKEAMGKWIPIGVLRDWLKDPKQREGVGQAYDLNKADEVIRSFDAFKQAYLKREDVEKPAQDFKAALAALSPTVYASANTIGYELQYNNVHPFKWAWVLYLGAVLVTLFALRSRGKALYATAIAFYACGFALHVYGFVLRCLIAGRPPVTNMYESVIWVGFGAVFFGAIFEIIYRRRLFMLAGSFAGMLCLVVMDLVPVLMGDATAAGMDPRIEPLVPVLQNNFWLTIHVLTITLSYAAFLLAAGMGHITLWNHLTRPYEKHEHRELHQFVYRVMQVGVLLLATGTILGGVWANYSWGRFWGWDPKETWALIALLCYLVVLHGRFTGLWTNFGLAFGSVFCFQAVMMAWYGVNFVLGSGKHAYGAGADPFKFYVLGAIGVDMLFLAAATISYLRHKNKQRPLSHELSAYEAEPEHQSDDGPVEQQVTLKPQTN